MTLKYSLVTKGMRPHDQLRKKLQQKVRKLETHLAHFPADAVHLQVSVQKNPKKTLFDAGLTLRLPSNVLRTLKSAVDPIPALDFAFKALLREVAGLKSSLRHEADWTRTRRYAFAPRSAAALSMAYFR